MHLPGADPSSSSRPRTAVGARPVLGAFVAAVAVCALVAAGCSSDSDDSTGFERSTTTAPTYGSHGMAPPTATVDEVAALGPGPAVGQTFTGAIGLNVCGRFVSVPATPAAAPTTGVSLPAEGRYSVTPTDDAAAGHATTIGDVAALLGVDLSTGSVGFGAAQQPAEIDLGKQKVQIAGATFDGDVRCGDAKADVQLWVYSADAVATGKGLVKVVEDPQDTPIPGDGMAYVIAVTPEWALPTLPPSAMS